MSALRPALLAGVLAITAGLQLWEQTGPSTGFSTLPILSPVSPELESVMREKRGQPTPVSPQRATKIVAAIAQDSDLSQSARTAAAKQVANATKSVGVLRGLRDRRHALNVKMMNVGVEIASVLTPLQWAHIHMHRDVRDGLRELDTMRRISSQLSEDQSD